MGTWRAPTPTRSSSSRCFPRPSPARRATSTSRSGQPPGARIRGDMIYFRTERITAEDTEAVARIVIGERRRPRSSTSSRSTTRRTRRRASGASASTCTASAAAWRRHALHSQRHPADGLAGPAHAGDARAGRAQNGMVLVVGAAGNGKSTSIASMIAHLNATRHLHIVTVEDPIEFLHATRCRASRSARWGSTRRASRRLSARRCGRIPTSSSWARSATKRRWRSP
jgi:hypothetical protein